MQVASSKQARWSLAPAHVTMSMWCFMMMQSLLCSFRFYPTNDAARWWCGVMLHDGRTNEKKRARKRRCQAIRYLWQLRSSRSNTRQGILKVRFQATRKHAHNKRTSASDKTPDKNVNRQWYSYIRTCQGTRYDIRGTITACIAVPVRCRYGTSWSVTLR